MIRIYELDNMAPSDLLNRDIRADQRVDAAVDAILADVRENGDEALKRYTKKFDGAELAELQVSPEEIEAAWAALDPVFIKTLEMAAENIRRFHAQQLQRDFALTDRPGIVLGQRIWRGGPAVNMHMNDRFAIHCQSFRVYRTDDGRKNVVSHHVPQTLFRFACILYAADASVVADPDIQVSAESVCKGDKGLLDVVSIVIAELCFEFDALAFIRGQLVHENSRNLTDLTDLTVRL
jgi:hypothetical protein